MTLLEQLQTHKGGLIQLKSQLWWHGGRGWDETPGRVCLLLDAADWTTDVNGQVWACQTAYDAADEPAAATAAAEHWGPRDCETPAAFLLINGRAHWVWVVEADVELLVNDPPTN